MSIEYGRLAVALVLAGGFCTLIAFSAQGVGSSPAAAASAAISSTSDVSAMTGSPSRYGLLTSSRWRYGEPYRRQDLRPVANNNPYPEPQPRRERPSAMVINPAGDKLYITLAGTTNHPSNKVVVFDIPKRRVTKDITVGSSPYYLAFHPDGRHLVVINRFSNYASVIDTQKDEVCFEIPLDFYCQSIVFNKRGDSAYISNRYLNQVFLVRIDESGKGFAAQMQPLGGYDDKAFFQNIHPLLSASCGAVQCHARNIKGFYAGSDKLLAFFSAMENTLPGDPEKSMMLKATRSLSENGFANDLSGSHFHADGRVIWSKRDEAYQRVADWIKQASLGPGIPVGNFGSKPRSMALSRDGRYLFVGNLGTQDVVIIDTKANKEIGAIYLQNVVTDLSIHYDAQSQREFLIALSMGIGFGAAKERDPLGGETTNTSNPAAQYTLLRDLETTDPLPLEQQWVLGTFDAIDGTAASKMSDIQNDVTIIDIGDLDYRPHAGRNTPLDYALKANRYEAHRHWVRYTSDSAEVLPQDFAGDIPPDLQRVVGAFPEKVVIVGGRMFVAMSASCKVVEWKINGSAREPSDYLEPIAVYKTGLMPVAIAVGKPQTPAAGLLFSANLLGETISVIDRKDGTSREYVVGNLSRPYPDTNSERGEMFFNLALFSADGDHACVSCHIYGTSDARNWGAGQAIAQMRDGKFVNGGLLGIPQVRNLFAIQPFYFEGTHSAFDAQFDDAREHVPLQAFLQANPQGDFTNISHPLPLEKRQHEYEEIQDKMSTAYFGKALYPDLNERRDELIRQRSLEYFGKAFNFRDFQRFIGEYQAAENRLMPNPFDKESRSVKRGRLLYNNLAIGCVVCHPPPEFTRKNEDFFKNKERTLPSLVTFTPREKSFTLVGPHYMDMVNKFQRDLEYWDEGRIEREQGHTSPFQLRGIFDRPFAFLHHGRALSLRETIAVPNHYSLRRFTYPPLRGGEYIRKSGYERGFNELSFLEEKTYMIDTRGATSHLHSTQIQDLENFLLTIE